MRYLFTLVFLTGCATTEVASLRNRDLEPIQYGSTIVVFPTSDLIVKLAMENSLGPCLASRGVRVFDPRKVPGLGINKSFKESMDALKSVGVETVLLIGDESMTSSPQFYSDKNFAVSFSTNSAFANVYLYRTSDRLIGWQATVKGVDDGGWGNKVMADMGWAACQSAVRDGIFRSRGSRTD